MRFQKLMWHDIMRSTKSQKSFGFILYIDWVNLVNLYVCVYWDRDTLRPMGTWPHNFLFNNIYS
jgi:hypothetical protein